MYLYKLQIKRDYKKKILERDYLFHNIQTPSWSHPTSCTMGIGGLLLGGHEADPSPPSSAEVKNSEAISLLSYTPSCHGVLIKARRHLDLKNSTIGCP
jgi:hypothetical protein